MRVLLLAIKIPDKEWRPCQDGNQIEMTATIEQLSKTIDANIQLSKFTCVQTDIKVSVLELRFEAGENEDEIELWSMKLDEDVGIFETPIVDLDARVKQSKSPSLEAAKKEEDHTAEIRVQKYEEMRLEKEKLEQRLKYEKQIEDSRKDQNKQDKSVDAKLPKLVITKFKGTHTDWL